MLHMEFILNVFVLHAHCSCFKICTVYVQNGHFVQDNIAAFYKIKIDYVSLQHKSSHKQHICSISQQYGSKLYIFILCQKSLDIKIMKIFHTVNILKLNF